MNFNFTFPPTFEESSSSPPVMSPLSSEEEYNTVELKSQLPALEEVLSHPALQQYVRRFEEVCVVPKNLIEYVQLHLSELLSVLEEANASVNEERNRTSATCNSVGRDNSNNSNNNSISESVSKSRSKTNEENSDDEDECNSNDEEPKCGTWISNCNNALSEYVDNNNINSSDSKNNISDTKCSCIYMRKKLAADIVSSNACNNNSNGNIESNSFINKDSACNCLYKEECEVPELILSGKNSSKHYDPTCNFINKPHSPLSCDCNSFDSINEVNANTTKKSTIRDVKFDERNLCEHNINYSENVLSNECNSTTENDYIKEVSVDLSKGNVDKDEQRLRCANAGELLLAYMIDTTSIYLIDKLVPIYLESLCGSTSSHFTEDYNWNDVPNDNISGNIIKQDAIISVEFAHHALLTCFDTSFVETTRCIQNALTSTMIDRITANLQHYSVVETLISLFGSALPATTMMAASTEPCIFTEHWVGGKFVERAIQRLPSVICSGAHYNYFQFWREVIKRGFGHSAGPIADVFLKKECINFFVQVTVAESHKLIISTNSTKGEVNYTEQNNNNDNDKNEEHEEMPVYRSSLCGEAISILVTIVNFMHRASITTCNRDMYYTSISNNAALHAIVEHLPEFVSLLHPQHTLVIENECLYFVTKKQGTLATNSRTIALLGNVRLQICKLCLELLQLNRYDIDKALVSSHFLPHLLILCRIYSQHAKLNEIMQEYILHIISRVPLEQETYADLITHDIHWLEYLATFSDCTNDNTGQEQPISNESKVEPLMALCQEQLSSLLSHQSHILHYLAEYAKDATLIHTSLSANAIYTLEQMHVLLNTILDTIRRNTCSSTCSLPNVNNVNSLEHVNTFLMETLQETCIQHRLENINHGIEGVNFASPDTLTLPAVVHKPVINYAPDREVSSPSTFTSPVMNQKWLFIKSDYGNSDQDKCTEQGTLKTEEMEANIVEHANHTTDDNAKICTATTTPIILPWVDKTTSDEAMYEIDDVVMVDVDSEDENSENDENSESKNSINSKQSNQNTDCVCDEHTLQECVREEEVQDDYILERTLTSILTAEIECENDISQYCQRNYNSNEKMCNESKLNATCNSQLKANDSWTYKPLCPLLITDLCNAEPRLLLTWHEGAKCEQSLSTAVSELETELVTNCDEVASNAQVEQEENIKTRSTSHDNVTQNVHECCIASRLPPELAEILKEGVAARRAGSAQVQAYPCFHTVYLGFRPNDIDDFTV